jgi:hypothetical protein
MINAFRQEATVQPGGKIEIRVPELAPGSRAEVIILSETSAPQSLRPLRTFIGAGKGAFATPEEADAFIRKERDSWD